jgi:hypothetical protein
VYNYGGGILENCDSPRYMIHHVAGYVTSRAEKRTIALRLIRLPVLSQYYTPITALGLLSLQRLRSCLCIRLTGKQSRLVFTVTNITVLCSKNVRYEEEYLNG